MDGTAFIAEVLRVAGELGLSSWERIALILVMAVLLVAARVAGRSAWKALQSVEVTPAPLDPERDPTLPDATSNLTTDPANPGGENGGNG